MTCHAIVGRGSLAVHLNSPAKNKKKKWGKEVPSLIFRSYHHQVSEEGKAYLTALLSSIWCWAQTRTLKYSSSFPIHSFFPQSRHPCQKSILTKAGSCVN